MRKKIVEKAREYLGTPFHHQGRLKGIGIDCIGLLSCVAHELGIFTKDNTNYSKHPDGKSLMNELNKYLDEIPSNTMNIGDILVFAISKRTKYPQHIGFVTDYGMIHTYQGSGEVVEHVLDDKWKKRICGCFKFRNLN